MANLTAKQDREAKLSEEEIKQILSRARSAFNDACEKDAYIRSQAKKQGII